MALSRKSREKNNIFELGTVVGTHGLKGELKLRCLYPELDYQQIKKVFLNNQTYALESFRWHKNNLLLKLQGINDLSAAEKYKFVPLYIDEETASAAEHFFAEELLGKEVVCAKQGGYLGKVTAVLKTPAHEVLAVDTARGELLIPHIAKFVLEVNERITVDISDLEEYKDPDANL